jgi:UDP-glucose 4-epimerase
MNKRYLVTGGAGFIGSHLCCALVAQGEQVIILDSLESGRMSSINDILKHDLVKFVNDTILNESTVSSLC